MTTMMKSSLALAALAVAFECARADMAEERQSRTYQAAMADYQAGRLDAAIAGFEKAIEANGNNASARFQLACVLQDHRKDWLGAMCSYREYLRLEGRSDKAPLARERLAQCERELAGELAKKYSLASSEEQIKAGEQLKSSLAEAEKNVAASGKALDDARKRVAVLERENLRLRRQMRMIGEDADEAAPRGVISARELLDGEDDDAAPRKIAAGAAGADDGASPSGGGAKAAAAQIAADEDGADGPQGKMDPAAFVPDDPSTGLRQGLADAKRLVEEDESGPELLQGEANAAPAAVKLTDYARRTADAKAKDRGDRPETYVVQDGDTLIKIARRFYGKESAWKTIRDANKATITTDGRVRTGQTIVLP